MSITGAARTVYVGGQNGIDADGTPVPGGLGEQTAQALANVERVLREGGAGLEQIVFWTILIVQDQPLADAFSAYPRVWGTRPRSRWPSSRGWPTRVSWSRSRRSLLSMPADELTPHVALLRGINVGGKNLISMPDLEECFRALGYSDVGSYINTGNVVFRASPTDTRHIEATIERELEGRFPQQIRTLVRTLDQMESLVAEIETTWPGPTATSRT